MTHKHIANRRKDMDPKTMHTIAVLYMAAINIAAVVTYGWDKLCAQRGGWRVPEKTLLLLAFFGGGLGAMAGMALFRHKTRHLKFRYGIRLMLALQIMALIYLHVRR